MSLPIEEFVHEEEQTDHPPMRYLPIRHVYSSSAPGRSPTAKKVKARKLSDDIEDEDDDDDEKSSSESKKLLDPDVGEPGTTNTAKKPILVYRRRLKKSRVECTQVKPEPFSEPSVEANDTGRDRERCDLEGYSVRDTEFANSRKIKKREFQLLEAGSGPSNASSRKRSRASNGPNWFDSKGEKNFMPASRKSSSGSNIAKKWLVLDTDGVDPYAFIGLQCKVYWPMDEGFYKGLVTQYDPTTYQHAVKYDDGDVEHLTLSNEKIKFHISSEEMQRLNLKSPSLEKKGSHDALLGLAYSFHDRQHLDPWDLIWAKLSGHAMWPAIILPESDFGSSKALKSVRVDQSIIVQFLGTHDFARIQSKYAVPFLNGMILQLHLKCKLACFYRSLDEAKMYLFSNELPKSMLKLQKKIEASDFGVSDEDGIDHADDTPNVVIDMVGPVNMHPIDLGDLRVTTLGKIVHSSEHFHDRKHIWPEGYTAFRKFTSVKDLSQQASYKMEVLRNSKVKDRPLFRVTLEDDEQIDGPTPGACWKEIYSRIRDKKSNGHAELEAIDLQKSGSYMFGFSNPQISQLIQELQNSIFCSKYYESCGDKHMGFRAVRVNWRDLDRCSVCDMDEEYEDNLFLQCDKCRMMVHARCYGELEPSNDMLWLCNICRPGSPKPPPRCCLCPVIGGAIKPTNDGRWAHLACAIWIPETCLIDVKRMEPIDGINQINKDRWKLLCSICSVPFGACIQCSHNTCYAAYHPLCARAAGLCVELEDEEKAQLMSLNEDDDQCIRLLSFCKKHRQPSNERPLAENSLRLPLQLSSNYIPACNISGCARSEPYNFSWRRGHQQPQLLAAASVKQLFIENMPYLITGCRQNGTAPAFSRFNDPKVGEPQQPMLENVSSMPDRYRNMKATFRKRLAFGKSKIHCFGVFAKMAHRAGDMVIEYIGELVRPPVADIRESRIYNSLVGAGTYMFRIDDERVIDATKAGSIAHLINHSCEPNCYSRVINVDGDDHIIIFAKRDINQWEELTYDYRFSSDEQLPCYCGFPRCRGVVNDTEAEGRAAKIWVPRCDLVQ